MKTNDNSIESLKNVVKILTEPVIIVDSNFEVLTANNDFKDSFDLKKYSVRKGANIEKILEGRDQIKEYILKTIKNLKTDDSVIIYQKRYYNIKVSKIRSDNKNYFFFLFHDVTEQEVMEIKTKKFTSNVAHELKTPLAGISSIAELIAFNNRVDELTMRQEAKYIYEEVQRLTKLVDDLLHISKFDKNPRLIQKEELDIQYVLDHVLNLLKAKIEEKELTIYMDIYETKIFADFDALVQIFINLIDNAIKYANTKIRIKTAVVDNKLRIKIEDDGTGLTRDQASKIFTRFYRTDESRNKNSGGTGLGLSIVKELISLHDAKISVRSKLNIGTDFIMDFPITEKKDEEKQD